MKKIILFLIIIVSFQIGYSQSGWFWQNPLPQGNDLNCIKFINNYSGWAVGDKGTIIKTTDAGNNWIVQECKTTEILYNILFINESTGVVVGEGIVLRTSNGGQNWQSVFTLANSKFNGVFFQNLLTGWICGYNNNNVHGIIYKTTNSGITWNLNFTSPYDERFYKISFLNLNFGFVGSGTSLYKTTNAGNNWVIVNYLTRTTDFDMIDSLNILFAGGYTIGSTSHGIIRKTTNGGSNLITIIDLVDTVLYSIEYMNSNSGFVCGQKGKILKTSDFGLNWIRVISGMNINLNSIFFQDELNGFVAGDFGTIMKSENYGTSWDLKTRGFNNNLKQCKFLNENFGWISGSNIALITTNGGLRWHSIWDSAIYTLTFINENVGWLLSIGVNGVINTNKTTNSGLNWILQNLIIPPLNSTYNVTSVQFLNQNTGHMVGSLNYSFFPYNKIGIYGRTTNGGINWNINNLGQTSGMYDIQFLTDDLGYMIGDNNKIYKTYDSGNNWSLLNGNNPQMVNRKISFVDENTGWLFGSYYSWPNWYPKIYRTINGGNSWEDQFPSGIFGLTSVFFFNENTGWVTSTQGSMFATSNGGVNWLYQFTPAQNDLQTVYFVSPGTGWVAGNNGCILKTTSGVVNRLRILTETVPNSFSLYQNYPNPFNPVTHLRFEIPELSKGLHSERFVKLIVYDLLGREVATLVSEQLKPGTYEVEWDGSNYSSGIYFYKLVSNDYIETKKMVLIK